MQDQIKNISVIILILLCFALNITNADQIDRYDSNITVLEDGTIDVVETIQISTDHEEIKLGITREIPTSFYFMNKRVETPIDVLSVMRNGKPENFWTENNGGNVEIFTGSVDNVVDNYLDKGKHTFVIHWQSQNHIRSFENYDELYFNAIGHNWRLPIIDASVTLNLPKSVSAMQSAAYYGVQGQTNQAKPIQKSPQEIQFIAPEILGNGKGFTVATGFTKGIIPSVKADQKDIIMDQILGYFPKFIQPMNIILFGAMIVMMGYACLGFCLHRLLTPKSRRAFMVRYSPPEHIDLDKTFGLVSTDPENIRMDRGMFGLLVDLNGKGFITIDPQNQQFIVHSLDDQSHLSNAQKVLLKALELLGKARYDLTQRNPDLAQAMNQTQQSLQNSIMQFYGHKLHFYEFFGSVLLAGILLISSLYFVLEDYLALIFVTLASAKLIAPVLMKYILPTDSKFQFMGIIAVVIGFVAGAIPMFGMQDEIINIQLSLLEFLAFYITIVVSLVISCICFYIVQSWQFSLKKKYVEDQQAVLEFKHFLAYTKEDEYQLITPDLFEEYLAYAIIFGVENKWLDLYKSLYPTQFMMSKNNGRTAFYSAAHNPSFFNGALSSSMPSNHHTQGYGSSRGSGGSGSGGGGSSGGGSGGGGGGGR